MQNLCPENAERLPTEREALQVVMQLLSMLLPAVAYWTWRAARLDSQAQANSLGVFVVLLTLAVLGLFVWRRRGLAVRLASGLLGLVLLGWLLAVAALGGGVKLDLILPFMGAVTAAMVAGMTASSRALSESHAALAKAEWQAAQQAEVIQPETLFGKAFELSPFGMSLSRASDGVFLAVNAEALKLQGYQPDELVGRSALEIDAWDSVAERTAFVEEVRQHEGRFETERHVRRKDGAWVCCRIWATLVDVGGEPCLLCAALDITPQKERESMLLDLAQGLASSSGEPFFRSAARYLAKAIHADLVMVAEISEEDGKLAALALWKDQAQVANTTFNLAETPFAKVLVSADLVLQAHPQGLRYAQVLSDTADVFHASAGHVLRDADGTPIGLLCAWWRAEGLTTSEHASLLRIVANRCNPELVRLRRDREIFRLKDSLEQRVQARTAQLRASNAELQSFGYSVSHDLQSPLRSIQGYLFLLDRRLKPKFTDEDHRLSERIMANVMRMHELINDLLALARVSRGQLGRESVNLSTIAEEVTSELQAKTPERPVRVNITPGLHAPCDAKLARIVFENLMGNAWKYSRKVPQAVIEFGALPTQDGEHTTFFIRDNGAGFNMEYAHSLFKPFHRLHHENEFEGSGIGLATVHRILERHGGLIRAEAVEGQGACFYFAFEGDHSDAES